MLSGAQRHKRELLTATWRLTVNQRKLGVHSVPIAISKCEGERDKTISFKGRLMEIAHNDEGHMGN